MVLENLKKNLRRSFIPPAAPPCAAVERRLQNGLRSISHLTLSLGLRRRASAKAAFASSILPSSAWAAAKFKYGVENAKTGVDRLVGFVDRGVEMAEAEFSVRHAVVPRPILRVARAQPNRLLHIGFRLFELAQERFGDARVSRRAWRNSD